MMFSCRDLENQRFYNIVLEGISKLGYVITSTPTSQHQTIPTVLMVYIKLTCSDTNNYVLLRS